MGTAPRTGPTPWAQQPEQGLQHGHSTQNRAYSMGTAPRTGPTEQGLQHGHSSQNRAYTMGTAARTGPTPWEQHPEQGLQHGHSNQNRAYSMGTAPRTGSTPWTQQPEQGLQHDLHLFSPSLVKRSHYFGKSSGAADRCCRWTAVCLGLLCVLLLGLSIGLAVWLLTERYQLLTNHSNLLKERDQLLTNHSNLLKESDQLLTNYSNLLKESDQLLTNYSNLLKESEIFNLTEKFKRLTAVDLESRFCASLDKYTDRLVTLYRSKGGNAAKTLHSLLLLLDQDTCGEIHPDDLKRHTLMIVTKGGAAHGSPLEAGIVLEGGTVYCQTLGGDLVLIKTPEKQRFITEMGYGGWIGLRKGEKNRSWGWLDDTPVFTWYWHPGEPNTASGNCVAIHHSKTSTNTWYDYTCGHRHYTICEVPAFNIQI
ncbi:hypothetical protein ACEWY4_022833 [Coilia grayii]|uniref:C-type lectin domain-containing protein n=1 Tax=Coilia grayii TaxID=363190 RepID=A0ABD1J3A5_9TELE